MRRVVPWNLAPVSRDQEAAGDIPVNLYAEAAPRGADAPATMNATPGTAIWCRLPTLPLQMLHTMGGVLYAVSGGFLYSINRFSDYTQIGELEGLGGIISHEDNGISLVMVGNGFGYAYSPGAEILDLTAQDGWLPASTVTYQDGRFIFTRQSSGEFFISDLYSTDVQPLSFATAEAAPDDTLAARSIHQQIWLFGERTIERWYNSGNIDFTFERVNSSVMETGIAAPLSLVEQDNSLFWLGDDRIVYRANGYTPTRISSHYVEAILAKAKHTRDASAYAITMEGHAFYVLTIPGALPEGITLVYDLATQLWHRRKHKEFGRHHCVVYAEAYGRHFVGDFQAGNVYQLVAGLYTDDEIDLISSVETLDIQSALEWMRHARLELDMDTGYGGSVMLEISDDEGKTWRQKPDVSIGAVGNFRHVVRWTRLGRSKRRRYRVSISSPVPRFLRALYLGTPDARS